MDTPAAEKAPPLLSVRPVFDPGLTMVESGLAAIFGGTVVAFVGGTILFLLLGLTGLGRFISAGGLYSTFLVLGLALSPAVYFEIKKAAFRRTVYNFHADILEYRDFRFLLQARRGHVRLRDIRDVYERASPLQSRRALSSIYLVIPNFPSQMQQGVPGIKILDVPESAGLRDKIVDLIEDSLRRYVRGEAPPAPSAVPASPPTVDHHTG
jgi:hypothetical protein